jgi:uncharacterized protein YdeI (YjbR/CyaY-like superfamily)
VPDSFQGSRYPRDAPTKRVLKTVASELITLEVRDRRRWRQWLTRNHSSSPGVWVVFHKAHTGVQSIDYEDLVCEALCFGWVDSLIKRLDENRFARKLTPRRSGSKWSDSNRKRWASLREAGLLAPAGSSAAPTARTYSPGPVVPELPDYIARALQVNARAWKFFSDLAPSSRRDFVVWIHVAKRTATREQRIRESVALLAAGKKLGLK